MPKMIDKYTRYEFVNNPGVASTLFEGYLKDKVSEEKKMEIMKKLYLPKMIEDGNVKDVKNIYGDKYEYLTKVSDLQGIESSDTSKEMPGSGLWVQPGVGVHLTDPRMEEPFQEFEDGMREMLEILDENEDKIDLSDPNAKNHYQMLKGFLKNSYEGTLGENIMEDATYGIAYGQTAKVGFEQCTLTYDEKKQKPILKKSGTPTQTVLKETAEIGILEGMAGGIRVHDKLQDHINTGNTSRQELINEFEEQSKRYDKVNELTEEKVKDLRSKNVLQNDRSEYTKGARGINVAVDDVKAKQQLLDAGYPAEDITHMSPFYVQMKKMEKDLRDEQAAFDKTVKDKPVVEGAEKEKREKQQESLKSRTEVLQEMQQTWNAVTSAENGSLTQEKRLETLEKMKAVAEKVKTPQGNTPVILNQFSDRIDKRIAAPLNLGDKAMLSHNYTEMYNTLTEADPRSLFTGSKQFKDLKKSVKELSDMDQKLDPETKMNDLAYLAKRREVMSKAQSYLRYKDRQMNGPDGHKHKRSELELKRVQAVSGIYNKLYDEEKRRLPELRLMHDEMPVVPDIKNQDLLTPKPSGEARNFDEYIRQHTGKSAMFGTKEEMIDDASKVLAAQIMPKQDPPKEFDPKVIDKAAAQIKDKFNLAQADEFDLRQALNDPKTIKVLAQQQHRKTYSVDPEDHKDFVTQMRRLYRDMEKPDGTSKEYQKIYEGVQKIAHLPRDPEAEGLSMNKVGKMLEKTNSEIFEAMDRYIDHYGKNMGPKDPKVLQVLNTMSTNLPDTEKRADRMVERINHIKNKGKDITDHEYVELEEFGRKGFYGLEKTTDKPSLSKSIRQATIKGMEMTEHEKLAYEKAKSMEQPRAKEAGDPESRKKLDSVEMPKKKSYEVGEKRGKGAKNWVKETKEAPRKKLDDGVYL